jgi:CopG family transcriptional regulator/antitoxin EndoAI
MKAAATTRRSTGYRRRNFTLRAETANLLDRLPREVNRSRLVDEAIRAQLGSVSRARLRKLVEAEAAHNAERDLRMVEEWFPLEEEAWEIAERAPRARR